MYFFLLVLIEHFVDPIGKIEFGTAVNDLFHFLDQLGHFDAFCGSDIGKGQFSVHVLNDVELQSRIGPGTLDYEVIRPKYVVLLHIVFDERDKWFPVFFCLTFPYPVNIGHLI